MKLKSIISVLFVGIMTCTGCLEKKPLIDAEKVGAVALEYMNSKYNQDFGLLSCEPSRDFGIEEQESYAKAEISLNDDKYLVKLSLSKDDKSGWEVYWDDYMNTIAEPFFKENMDNILQNELDIKEFTSCLCTFSRGYSDRFPVLDENDTLKEITDSCATALIYEIDMPESSHYEGMDKDIQKALDPYFPHGILDIYIDVYSDGCYSRCKEEPEKYHDEKPLFSYDIEIKGKPYQK